MSAQHSSIHDLNLEEGDMSARKMESRVECMTSQRSNGSSRHVLCQSMGMSQHHQLAIVFPSTFYSS